MPALGLGVYQSTPGEMVKEVKTALEDAYRLIDTAAACANEEQSANSQVFVIAKLRMSNNGDVRLAVVVVGAFAVALGVSTLTYLYSVYLESPMVAGFLSMPNTARARLFRQI